MLQPRSGSSVGTPAPRTPPFPSYPALLRRSEPVRCLLIALLSVGLGVWVLRLLLPILPAEALSGLIAAHLPRADTHPLLFWLSLCGARFPFWLLPALAGMTRFSGGLTSAVLVWRGLCDGAALGLLGSAAVGDVAVVLPEGLSAWGLLAAVAGWCLLDTAIRLVQVVAARRMARLDMESPTADGRMEASLREAVWTYTAFSLATLCATLAACGGYAWLILRLV